MRSIFRALASALALTLALVPATFAATTGSVSETLTVTSTLSMTLDVSAISYGTLAPGTGTNKALPVPHIVSTISGNVPWTFDVVGSALSGPGGATIAASNREIQLGRTVGDTDIVLYGPPLTADVTAWYPTGSLADDASTVNGTGTHTIGTFHTINVPAGARAGSYTGTLTFTVTGS